METNPVLAQFAQRLNEVCDDMGVPEQGRQSGLARKVSELAGKTYVPNAVRKWLNGLGMPELSMAIRLANWAGVSVTWLLQGTEPKRGAAVPMSAVIFDEAMRELPADAARSIVNHILFTLHQTYPATDPRRKRYEAAARALPIAAAASPTARTLPDIAEVAPLLASAAQPSATYRSAAEVHVGPIRSRAPAPKK